MKKDKEFIAYCGLYCRDCILYHQKLFNFAQKLREELDNKQFEKYAELKSRINNIFHDYETFKKVLSAIIELRCTETCINNGGNPNCRIRKCVRRKEINGCWECLEFKHCKILELLSTYHGYTPKFNLRLIKQYGMKNWADKRGKHYIWENKIKRIT